MSRPRIATIAGAAAATALAGAGICYALLQLPPDVRGARPAGRLPRISPDYAGVVIPPNIAPLNFSVLEPGRRYCARATGPDGRSVETHARSVGLRFPLGPWRELLRAARGGQLKFEVFVQGDDDQWLRFEPFTSSVATEPIDSHLVYRLIRPLYNLYADMGIYQRHLEGFDESVVVHNRSFGGGCINCHTFLNHSPADMLVHVRGVGEPAMILAGAAVDAASGRPAGGGIARIDTRTQFNKAPAAYSAWHPGGQFITFSVNKLTEFNHYVGETRDVFDAASDLGGYFPAANAVRSSARITQPDRLETFPAWSPDGRQLFFCAAAKRPFEAFRQAKYDLMRIRYDPDAGTWGEPETLVSAERTGLSAAEPRVSPDGRYVLFCLAEYGSFPVYRPDSDLYLLDLTTGRHERMTINSDRCESWHCWSSNGRWIVFSSKRDNGLLARPYIAYFDAAGKAHKAFILPQKDPRFYDSFLRTYNVPELVKGPIPHRPADIARAIMAPVDSRSASAISGATPKASVP